MNTKYKKSEKCAICEEQIVQSKTDGKFLCKDCILKYQDRLMELLKANSQYKDRIKEISIGTASRYGISHKTTIIKLLANKIQSSHVYVKIPTYKILETMELNDDTLLFEYLETEMHTQYLCMIKKYKEQTEQDISSLLKNDKFKNKSLQYGLTLEEGYEKVKERMFSMYNN